MEEALKGASRGANHTLKDAVEELRKRTKLSAAKELLLTFLIRRDVRMVLGFPTAKTWYCTWIAVWKTFTRHQNCNNPE